MKKVLFSAFAMSLIIFPVKAREASLTDLSELEAEILPELIGPQKFTTQAFHQQESWQVKEKDVDLDKEPLKGQPYSLIPWGSQNPEEWLSVDKWLLENEIKSKHPDWKLRLRDDNQLELLGKVLSCKGKCPIFRGTMPASGQFLSRLVEGDEIRTDKDSEAWIFLIDGTLVRMGAETSLSLQEINLGKDEIFILARLNKGHVFWHPRPKEELPLETAPETATLGLPLQVLEANQQYFERMRFRSQKYQQQMIEVLEIDDEAIKEQVKQVNELRALQDKNLGIPTKLMMVAPNVTLISTQLSFDLVYVPGGASYFKKRGKPEQELTLGLRGYTDTDMKIVTENEWHEVALQGRTYSKMETVPAPLQLMELITKRIKSFELAREIWIKKFTLPLLAALSDPKFLAIEHGHTLWGEESKKRFEYLLEYTRRIETTNIKSIDNLLTKTEAAGHPVFRELRPDLYEFALNHYLKGLKTRYTDKRMQVREMNDLQYYVWTLRNGKL